MSNKKYDKQFKLDAVKATMGSDSSIAQVAIDLGLNTTTLYAWVSKYRSEVLQTDVNLTPEQELVQLRKENSELRQEKEILKKAAAYFEIIFLFATNFYVCPRKVFIKSIPTKMFSSCSIAYSFSWGWVKHPQERSPLNNSVPKNAILALCMKGAFNAKKKSLVGTQDFFS